MKENKDFIIDGDVLVKYVGEDEHVVVPNSVKYIDYMAFAESNVVSLLLTNNIKNVAIDTEHADEEERENLVTVAPPLRAPMLKEIFVTSDNPYFTAIDGVLYDKNKDVLIKVPEAKEGTLVIDKSVIDIHYGALGYGEINTVIFPPSLSPYLYESGFSEIGDCNSIETIAVPPGFDTSKLWEVNNDRFDRDFFEPIDDLTVVFANEGFYNDAMVMTQEYNDRIDKEDADIEAKFEEEYGDIEGLSENDFERKFNEFYAEHGNYGHIGYYFAYLSDDSLEQYYSDTAKSDCYKIEDNVLTFNSAEDFYSCLYTQHHYPYNTQLIVGNEPDVKKIIIPDGVDYLPSGCLKDFKHLEELSAPSVTEIADYAMCGCTSLKETEFSPQLAKIGDSAFYHCESITSINLPDTVEYLGNSAYGHCYNLESAIIPNDKMDLCRFIFEGSEKVNVKPSFQVGDLDKVLNDTPSPADALEEVLQEIDEDSPKIAFDTIPTNTDPR